MPGIVGEYSEDYLLLNSAGTYSIGDIAGAGNGTIFGINDTNRVVGIEGSAFTGMVVDFINGVYKFGNISGGNLTFLDLDDTSQKITAKCVSGLYIEGSTQLIGSNTSLANGAGAAAGTLTNAPAAGNPTKWVPIDDNGTTRYIPAW